MYGECGRKQCSVELTRRIQRVRKRLEYCRRAPRVDTFALIASSIGVEDSAIVLSARTSITCLPRPQRANMKIPTETSGTNEATSATFVSVIRCFKHNVTDVGLLIKKMEPRKAKAWRDLRCRRPPKLSNVQGLPHNRYASDVAHPIPRPVCTHQRAGIARFPLVLHRHEFAITSIYHRPTIIHYIDPYPRYSSPQTPSHLQNGLYSSPHAHIRGATQARLHICRSCSFDIRPSVYLWGVVTRCCRRYQETSRNCSERGHQWRAHCVPGRE